MRIIIRPLTELEKYTFRETCGIFGVILLVIAAWVLAVGLSN